MKTLLKTNRRLYGLDILKVLAAYFVLILHINGYSADLFSIQEFDKVSYYTFYIMQAVAYPAIHLFVLAGSYLMISEKKSCVNIKSIATIWSQTFLVTVIGVIVLMLFSPSVVSGGGILRSLFPFLGRAYWFVSDYIILLILSPVLIQIVYSLESRTLLQLTAFLFLILSVFRSLIPGWKNEGNLMLFILLFLIAACFQRHQSIINVKRWQWGCLWYICISLLVLSVISINVIQKYIGFFTGRQEWFYNYNSILVIGAAVALFGWFKEIEIKTIIVERILRILSSETLVVYLLHMHPIAKEHYTEWGLLRFVNISGGGTAYMC